MQKARTRHLGRGPGESLHGTAPRELVQQVDEDVDPFREARVFVGGSSQKLGVDVLVGFEGHIFFHVIAGGQTEQDKTERRDVNSDAPTPSRSQPPCPQGAGALVMPRPRLVDLMLGGLFLDVPFNASIKTQAVLDTNECLPRTGTAPGRERAACPCLLASALWWRWADSTAQKEGGSEDTHLGRNSGSSWLGAPSAGVPIGSLGGCLPGGRIPSDLQPRSDSQNYGAPTWLRCWGWFQRFPTEPTPRSWVPTGRRARAHLSLPASVRWPCASAAGAGGALHTRSPCLLLGGRQQLDGLEEQERQPGLEDAEQLEHLLSVQTRSGVSHGRRLLTLRLQTESFSPTFPNNYGSH